MGYCQAAFSPGQAGDFLAEEHRNANATTRLVAAKPNATLELNSGFGLTSEAADWAPEIGIVLALPDWR